MTSSIGSISQMAYVSEAAQAPPPRPKPQVGTQDQDTVQISAAARQALTQKPAEATETPAQTTQEAAAGDPMALAKQAKERANLQ